MLNNLFDRSTNLEPLSIDRLTRYIERALTQTPELRQVWVTGEVSSANFHPSGIYFTLKDPVGKATLPSVVWKDRIRDLETKPQVGTQVCALGTIVVYAPHGKYQFQVQQVLPLGEGLQALRYTLHGHNLSIGDRRDDSLVKSRKKWSLRDEQSKLYGRRSRNIKL